MSTPSLGPKAIDAYNRFSKELAAFNYALRGSKLTGTVDRDTLLALNGLIAIAQRLFRRHADLPRFSKVDPDRPMTQADLALHVSRLTSASLHFQDRYDHLKARSSFARRPLPLYRP